MTALRFTLILSLLLFIAGCGDSEEGGVTATLNDAEFTAEEFGATYFLGIRQTDSGNRPEYGELGVDPLVGKFQLYAVDGRDPQNNGTVPQRRIVLTVSGVDGPGSYDLVRGDQDIQRFQLAVDDHSGGEPKYYTAPVSTDSLGTLVIASLPTEPGVDGMVSGSFSFTLPPAGADAEYEPVVVGGEFEVPVAVVPGIADETDDAGVTG
jgi:hypothetical protein